MNCKRTITAKKPTRTAFRDKKARRLVRKERLSLEWAERILSWRHTGFNVHGGRGRGSGRGSGRGPRLCLGIIFRRTQPRIYIAGECPRLCLRIIFRRTQPRIYIAGECPRLCLRIIFRRTRPWIRTRANGEPKARPWQPCAGQDKDRGRRKRGISLSIL